MQKNIEKENDKYGFHISRAYDTQFAKQGLARIM